MSIDKDQKLQQLRRAVALARLQQRGGAQLESTPVPPILRVDRDQPLPLSWAQQRLWFLDQLDQAAGAAYHVPAALRLSGDLNREALRASLDRIVARHENLRTTFVNVEGSPRQVIAQDVGFSLIEQDLRDLDEAAQAAAVDEVSGHESRAPFDLSRGPLIRGRLLRLAEDEHVLLVTQHHIISDGWSTGVLVKEVSALYAAFSLGQADPLPPLPIQYADYAAWQRQWLQGDALLGQIDYWRNHLSGAPALLELPTDRPRPPEQSYRGDRVGVVLAAELTAALRTLSQRHGTTMFMTLLAGWSALLSRLTSQDDIVIGSPVANRQRAEIEPLIGFFVNTLALRVDLSSDPSVAVLLDQVKATALGAYTHQNLPFEQVVEALQPVRSLSHSPVFQVMFSLNNVPGKTGLNLLGVELSRIESAHGTAHFDLSLGLTESDEGISGTLEYATDLFDRSTVERILGHWQTLLRAMVKDTTQAVSRLPLLSEPERTQVLAGFNATQVDWPQDRTIHALFEAQASQNPDAVALVFEEQHVSYGALNRRANRVAHRLIERGVKPDDRVAICAERSIDMVVGLLGILKAGGAYVPLDPSYPMDRLAFMLGDSAPTALLTQAALVEGLPLLRDSAVPTLILDEETETASPVPDSDPVVTTPMSKDLAYVMYTSGSTGQPKGVMVEHRNVVNLIHSHVCNSKIKPGDRILQFSSYSFDSSIDELFPALSAGATVVLRPAHLVAPDDAFAAFLTSHRITIVGLPTAFWHQWAQSAQGGNSLVGPALRLVVVGGEKLELRHLSAWFSVPALRGSRLLNTYGPTEATVYATMIGFDHSSTLPSHEVPIGRPIANTQTYILDGSGEPVPVGVIGEIHLAGAGVARGYLDRPELTAEKFVADPFREGPDARMYRTGDLGRWLPDGNIEYMGRNDFQVKIRGFRIELGEIEAKLAMCAGVRDAVVIARDDMGGDKRIVAYVVPHDTDAVIPAADLRELLLRELPEYMVPSAFVQLDALPMTHNGKLDRKALPRPDQSAVQAQVYEAPQGKIEQDIADVWQELLGLGQVGRHDHFFELGGHSLLVISLIERLRQRGLNMDVRTVFTAPTLSTLAARLAQADHVPERASVAPNLITESTAAIVPELLPLVRLTQQEIDSIVETVPGGASNVQDIYPLAPLQEGILFHHLLGGEGDTYLLRMVMAFDSHARLQAFLGALQTVIDRHDILRSSVHWEGLGKPVQVVHRRAVLPVTEHELSKDEEAIPQFLGRLDSRRMRLDLRQAPLLAAHSARDPETGEWLLALFNHHMVSDHVAQELILLEIQALLQGQGEDLPAPLPYRNFIAQTYAIDDAEHEAYFREQLGDVDEPTAPFGVLDVQDHGREQLEARLLFGESLAQDIRDTARRHGVTPAVLFHVAWAQVLAECSGRDDVVFGTVLSGRLQGSDAADQVVGMFINSLPVRIRLAQVSVLEAVRDTYTRLSELLAHEQAPLALAQRCSGVSQRLPLFTALLNYRYNNGSGSPKDTGAAVAWDGVRLISSGKTHGSYPLTVSVEDWGQALGLSVLYVPALDGERLLRYLETAMEKLVEALANAPTSPVRLLAILPEAERAQVLTRFNATRAEYPRDELVHELFQARARSNPDALALVHGEHSLSYDVLNRRANQVAHYLRSLGVKPDDRVAICMDRSIEMVVGLLGVLKAGGAYVPLDPTHPAERLADILKNDLPVALLTVAAVEDNLPALSLLRVVVVDDEPSIARQPDHNPDAAAMGLNPRHLAYVIYTSGSTGQPKGVMVPHQGVVNYLAHAQAHYLTDDIQGALVATPLGFDATVTTLLAPWLAGRPVVLLPEDNQQCLAQLLSYCARPEPWLFKLTPAHLDVLANLGDAVVTETAHRLVVGGEQLTVRVLKRFREHVLPRAIVVNEYGPTETVVGCTTFVSDGSQDALLQGAVPIGRSIPNTRIYILGNHGQPVPVGVAGEIHIGGAGVARGYLNHPELTAERFLQDPFYGDADARMYKSGDVGRWLPDGNLEYLGRNDFQVKIRGFRIELGEIEAKLAACAGIREAVVIAREDAAGDKRLLAYVVADAVDLELLMSGLRERLSRQLPDYMIPSAFVSLTNLPLTANGKLDRKALPAPDHAAVASREYEAPMSGVEQVVAEIWQQLLGLERIGRHDDFFELGGHSLLAVQLVTRLRALLGVEVALGEVFAQPTLSMLARTVASAASSSQDAIVPVDRNQALPLSWAQQRLWFLDQLDHVAGAAYHIPAALRLSGDLNRSALRASLDRIVARHENLRTTFASIEGSPQQVIAPQDSGFKLIEHDLRELDETTQATAVTELARSEACAPFSLSSGPLIRGRLLRLAEHEHVLLVTQHHIISDGWSISVLVQEVSTLYTAFSLGQDDPLPPLPIQYVDYAAWQRQWLQGEVLQGQLDFWRDHLTGAPALLELPTDRPRPAMHSYNGDNVSVRLSRELSTGLNTLARRHGATLFMTLLAGWSALLSRLSGQDDIVIGSPVANRQRSEIESLIGFFVNTLALRVDLSADPSVSALLKQIKATMLGAYAHQELPFEQVVELLQPERSLSHNAVFQASLSLNNTPSGGEVGLPGLVLSGIESTQRQPARFDLALSLVETSDGLTGGVIYAADLFDRSTVERMMGHFVTLLEAMVADDARAISGLPLLSPEQREQVLVEFNARHADYPKEGLIHALFEEQAARNPQANALEYDGHRLSYAELNERANGVAHRLIALGVKPDDRVAICAERSLEIVVGVLGILKAGGAYVPIDPFYPADRASYMLADSAPVAVLTQSALRDRLPMLATPGCPVLALEQDFADWTLLGNPEVQGLASRHLAYVIYTSGSTGQPKGVMVEHASIMNLRMELERSIFGALGKHDRVGLNASLSFDASIKSLLQLLAGRCLVIIPQAPRADGRELLNFLADNRIDAFDCTPAQLESMLAAGLMEHVTYRPKAVLIGGEPIAINTWQRLSRSNEVRFFNVYGPTECTVDSSLLEINGAGDRPQIGRPLANVRIYILDAQHQPVPVGAIGELYIAGVGLARGYLNREALTAERFLKDPFSGEAGARMYKTGDVGRWWPDGSIEYLGRNDFQVKVRGFRIELGEIEAKLAGCEGIREAVVVARGDATGDKRLVAYLVSEAGVSLSAAQLREQLSCELPEYMVPSAFVSLDAFPLTPNGKLDRKALPAPDQDSVASRAFEAPVGEVESAIAEVWQELLELERVGRHDHFFELGGHSLMAVRVAVRLKELLQVDLDLRDVFITPQLSALAEIIMERQLAQFDESELLEVLMDMNEAPVAD